MSSIVNKIKDAVHSDKDKKHDDTTGTHSHAATGTHGTTHGTHGVNDPIGTTGAGNTFGGDHTAISTGVIHATPMTGQTGTESAYAAGAYGTGPAPNTAGHHKSDALNKADPRIDSDFDGSRTAGGAGTGPTGAYGTTSTTTGGLHGTSHTHGTTGATTGTTGLGSGHPGGYAGTGAGANTVTGYDDTQGVHGPHSSRVANTADPRVDSDRDHRGAPGTHGAHATTGSHPIGSGVAPGPAPHTAGPHKQDILNKADPRVDSNLDGSKTVGGNKTYGA